MASAWEFEEEEGHDGDEELLLLMCYLRWLSEHEADDVRKVRNKLQWRLQARPLLRAREAQLEDVLSGALKRWGEAAGGNGAAGDGEVARLCADLLREEAGAEGEEKLGLLRRPFVRPLAAQLLRCCLGAPLPIAAAAPLPPPVKSWTSAQSTRSGQRRRLRPGKR